MRKGSGATRSEAPSAEELSSRLELLESKIHAAKIAYLNRTPFDGKDISYDELVAVAEEYVRASYALQKRKFGAIKVRMSVAKLLR